MVELTKKMMDNPITLFRLQSFCKLDRFTIMLTLPLTVLACNIQLVNLLNYRTKEY